MKQSEFLSLGWRDFLRGLLMAVLTPIFVIVQQSIDAGILTFNFKMMAMAGLSAGVAYMLKNALTKPDTKTLDIGGSNTPIKKDEK